MGADDGHINTGVGIAEHLAAAQLDQGNDIFCCPGVESAAALAGIHKGVQTDIGQGVGLPAGDVLDHAVDGSHGSHIGLQLVFADQLAHAGAFQITETTADGAAEKPLVCKVLQSAMLAHSVDDRVNIRQAAWMAGGYVPFFQGGKDAVRKQKILTSADYNGVMIVYQLGRRLA